jgi:DNA-binding beta-propeller fold protein YncE
MGTNARFSAPSAIALSPDGRILLVCDTQYSLIRKVDILAGKSVTTLAGTGKSGFTAGAGTNAKFDTPRGISFSPDGAAALIADSKNHKIRHIDLTSKDVVTICGANQGFRDGTGTNAKFTKPHGVAYSPDGLSALIADKGNHRVRMVILSSKVVTTLAGKGGRGSTDGIGTLAKFDAPLAVAWSPDGQVAVVSSAATLREIVVSTR